MGQFRTTADIADEVLQKSGEPTNGTSAYEDLVITYLNKAQQALVGGGSIYSLKVDEVWTWAKAKYPIVLNLEPIITGTVAAVFNEIGVTFTDTVDTDVTGWNLQLNGTSTVYRILAHTGGAIVAVLDSGFVDTTGVYGFRLWKSDYDLIPTHSYIDSTNDRIDFVEVGTTQLTAVLDHGAYRNDELVVQIANKLNLAGTTGLYSGDYDPNTRKLSITSTLAGGKIFSLLGATGTNRKRSGLPLLGLDRIDYSGAGTYESTYVTNGVSRLVEPFRVYSRDNILRTITSTDITELNATGPNTFYYNKGIPSQFARIREDFDGTVTVRFNCFPDQRTKVEIDYVPIPIDLQDHDGSIPVVPRKEIDVLIHAAAMFIQFDKEDDKWQASLKLVEGQLNAMEKKQRSEAFRTGDGFAQIQPRADLGNRRYLRYGYPWNPGNNASTAPDNVPAGQTNSVTLPYTAFMDVGATKQFTARVLPSNHTLFAMIVKHTIQFAGTGITQLLLDIGTAEEPTKFINGFDLLQAVTPIASDSVLTVYYAGGVAKEIMVRATATGANLDQLSAGSVDIFFQESVIGGGI